MTIFSILFQFVMKTIVKYDIDESHGLSHAFQILTQANSIYESEVVKIPELKQRITKLIANKLGVNIGFNL